MSKRKATGNLSLNRHEKKSKNEDNDEGSVLDDPYISEEEIPYASFATRTDWLQNSFGLAMTELVVGRGENEKIFSVHQKLLRSKVPYFSNRLIIKAVFSMDTAASSEILLSCDHYGCLK